MLWAFVASPQTVLTNAVQVRALTPNQSSRHLPVRLRGVVTGEAEPDGDACVIWDGTSGIYLLSPTHLPFAPRRGDLIEAEGVTDPGGFAPIVLVRSMKKIGRSENFQLARAATFGELVSGQLDGQWVEVSGVVRHCGILSATNTDKSLVILATSGERLPVQVNDGLPADSYVDDEVRLRGICFNVHNLSRQIVSPLLLVPRGVPITVQKPAPANPFDTPPSPVSGLMQFATVGSYGHRVHVRGIVTHWRPGILWIQSEGRGLRVQCNTAKTARPGDEVDVLGFPDRGDYSPILEDATFQKRGSISIPTALLLTNLVMALEHDADLVELDKATLSEFRSAQDGVSMTLDWHGSQIKALLRLPKILEKSFANWKVGSVVRATGICSVLTDTTGPVSGVWEPQSFQLLLRSPLDLKVIQPPPWWTFERILRLLVLITATSLLAVAAVMLAARRRLRQEAIQRATAEAEFSAMFKERSRIAREIHDTLAQGLGAVSMQLELAKNGAPLQESVAPHIETAHKIVRATLNDARNSIWNMRAQVLESGNLADALDTVLRQLSGTSAVETRMQVTGKPRRLPPVVENDLLRIGQEAITNAIRHANAKHILVRLDFSGKTARLSVADDGCGFDISQPPPRQGSFGLMGMRERAVQLRSELIVRSAPGTGAEVTVVVKG